MICVFLFVVLVVTEVTGMRIKEQASESDEQEFEERRLSCLEEKRANDDPCITITFDNGCDYELDFACYGEQACRRHIAAMGDPCIVFAEYDAATPSCRYKRIALCERAFGAFESVKNGVKSLFL